MSAEDRQRWNEKYASRQPPAGLAPDPWLAEQLAEVSPGRALELACGLGHNAIWLAQRGWQVDAVDISSTGLLLAENLARRCGAQVNWVASDLDEFEPEPNAYDLVCVFRFLDRVRLPGLIACALRPGGCLLYETFTRSHLDRPDSHLKNPAYALQPGELPRLFPTLVATCSDELALPDRNVARMAARRPSAN
ncbi:MAG: class I SAM-dependent methyltransferase [Planctomycetales bacterium]